MLMLGFTEAEINKMLHTLNKMAELLISRAIDESNKQRFINPNAQNLETLHRAFYNTFRTISSDVLFTPLN
jgi:hypothetical protein